MPNSLRIPNIAYADGGTWPTVLLEENPITAKPIFQIDRDRPIDLLSIGRVGIDLFSERTGHGLLNWRREGNREIMQTFRAYLGGTPGNVAFGAARLGLSVVMVSRVSSDCLGEYVRCALHAEGVDTSLVQVDDEHLTSLAILGMNPPEDFPHIFYREDCADMYLQRQELDEFKFSGAKAVFVTGAGLTTPNLRETTLFAVKAAKQAGAAVVLGIDYRQAFWTSALRAAGDGYSEGKSFASSELREILKFADVIIGNEEETLLVGGTSDIESSVASMFDSTDALIIVTRGKSGSQLCQKGEKSVRVPGYDTGVLNPVGSGDAFVAGFLYGWLPADEDADILRCVKLGNAAGAIVAAQHACAQAMPRPGDLNLVVSGGGYGAASPETGTTGRTGRGKQR